MARKIINDMIVPPRSIRQIPITRVKPKTGLKKPESLDGEEEGTIILETGQTPNWQRRSLNPKFGIWLVAIICLLAMFFGISILFSSATIIITPRTEKLTFTDDIYIAKSNTPGIDELSFEILKVTQEGSEIVEATEEKDIKQKASGKIIIYNNYSSASQRLINNTRFEANNGKVYRIDSSVVVPGTKKENGKTIPGSIEATVYADQPGEDYNLKLEDLAGDFKVPGFKGDPRYESFYARLKGDITGGFIGIKRIISDEARQKAEGLIKLKLNEQLLKELYSIKPENYLIFKDGYSIEYTNLQDIMIDKDKVQINLQGDIRGIVFNNSKMSKYIASEKSENYDGLPIEMIPFDNLTVIFKASDNISLWKNDKLELLLNGDANIKWTYDTDLIKKDLAGKKEADLLGLMTKYKNSVTSISVIFKPVWSRYIPDKLSKIKIIEDEI